MTTENTGYRPRYAGWTPERRAAHAELIRSGWTAARRAAHGDLTRAMMVHEEVRERIRSGMVRARKAKLETMLAAWASADKRMRAEFLAEVFARELQG
jgi:hypothetical protein